MPVIIWYYLCRVAEQSALCPHFIARTSAWRKLALVVSPLPEQTNNVSLCWEFHDEFLMKNRPLNPGPCSWNCCESGQSLSLSKSRHWGKSQAIRQYSTKRSNKPIYIKCNYIGKPGRWRFDLSLAWWNSLFWNAGTSRLLQPKKSIN